MTPTAPASSIRPRQWLLIALLVSFAVVSLAISQLYKTVPAGADFSAFWAGAKAALMAPERLYDFRYITDLQGWPLGPDALRPYPYPPSALLVFVPFGLLPYWPAYALWTVTTMALMAFAGRRIAAPWWFLLCPWVAHVCYAGQVTFLVGGLTLVALAWRRERPLVAGLALGLAAVVKPQIVVLIPIALLAARDFRTLAWTLATGVVLGAVTLPIWGMGLWFDWLGSLGPFQDLIMTSPKLLAKAMTPYAFLQSHGLPGAWAYVLAPAVIAATWLAFRRGASLADQSIVIFGGAILISPYAMNYEAALFAPALALYLARLRDRMWFGYALAATMFVIGSPLVVLLATLALPVMRLIGERLPMARQPLQPAALTS